MNVLNTRSERKTLFTIIIHSYILQNRFLPTFIDRTEMKDEKN